VSLAPGKSELSGLETLACIHEVLSNLTRARWLMRSLAQAVAVCVFLGLGYGLSAGLVAAQQDAPTIDKAALRLWPEYDDPGLLVIFSGSFSDSTRLPLKVAFPLPAGARGIQATAADPQAGLLNQPWELVDGSLSYTLPLTTFHTEYYLDRPPSGVQRDITYSFTAPYPIALLEIDVQQPARATGFSVSPLADRSDLGSDGLTHHTITRRNLAAGEKIDITMRYSKADTGLSKPPAAPPAGLPAASVARDPTAFGDRWLPWVLIGLGIGVFAAAGIFWFARGRGVGPAGAALSHQGVQRSANQAVQAAGGAPESYCTQCGRKLGLSDRFCATCGTERRV
jgi:hypothetical protein